MTDTSLAALLEVWGDGRHGARRRRLMRGVKIDPLLYLHRGTCYAAGLPRDSPQVSGLNLSRRLRLTRLRLKTIACESPSSTFSD